MEAGLYNVASVLRAFVHGGGGGPGTGSYATRGKHRVSAIRMAGDTFGVYLAHIPLPKTEHALRSEA